MSSTTGGTIWRRALLLMAAALALDGCKADLCESKPPAFQLDLDLSKLPATDRARIKSFRVDVNAAGKHKEQPFNAGTLGTETSVSVTVGTAGAAGFSAEVVVEARDDQGATLAQGKGTFKGVGNACNFFKLVLGGNPPDAGLDLPVPDGQPDAAGDTRPADAQPDRPLDVTTSMDRSSDVKKPDGQKLDGPKPDQPKSDQKKPDQQKPDLPKPDQPKPDQKKPDQQKPDLPLKNCATLYGSAPYYTLCTEGATSCVFYTSTYPNAGTTCNAVCGTANCIGATTPQGWQTTTERCTSTGTVTCATNQQSRICTCKRTP